MVTYTFEISWVVHSAQNFRPDKFSERRVLDIVNECSRSENKLRRIVMNYVDPEKIRVCVQNDWLNLKSIRVISLNVFLQKKAVQSCVKVCLNVKPKLIVLVAISGIWTSFCCNLGFCTRVGKVRPAGQIRPAYFFWMARGEDFSV